MSQVLQLRLLCIAVAALAAALPVRSLAQTATTVSAPLPPAPAGISGNFTCRNQRIGAVALDNVVVAPNAACQLVGTVVRGSLDVGPGSSAELASARIAGSVMAEAAAALSISGTSTVAGNVQVLDGGSAQVVGARIGGSLQFEQMGGSVVARSNTVGGDLQVVGVLGTAAITSNRITGNLQCSENAAPPTLAGNLAAAVDGQCLPPAPIGGGGAVVPGSNLTCNGQRVGAIVLDSVIVPPNGSCTLQGTRLTGNLEVGAGGRLLADGVRVNGGMTADGAAAVSLTGGSSVLGSVQIQRGLAATVSGSTIGGDLQVDAMLGAVLANGNRISGNLQAHDNRGGVQLLGNRVSASMQCKGNLPAPAGGGNVALAKQDQCRGL